MDKNPVNRFSFDQDLLLAHFDCKTDVDDLHSVAAMATLLAHPDFQQVNYYAVAGAYGVQEGLYVPPNELFQAAFGERWSDAHSDFGRALLETYAVVMATLSNGGDVWIPEAGQSDFSAALVRQIRERNPQIETRARIHIVQHSKWNEDVTSAESLAYVKQNTDYHRIPDGNVTDNGTPGFRSHESIQLTDYISDTNTLYTWKLALDGANVYNGSEGRYLNEAVAAGGLDFSDLSETCWIFGLQEIRDANEFFSRFGQ